MVWLSGLKIMMDKRSEWLSFCKTSFLFLSIPGAVFLIGVGMLFLLGEFISVPDAAEHANTGKPFIYSKAYMPNEVAYLRRQLFQNTSPEAAAIGNSRVMQIRSEFFNPDVRFINMGGPSEGIDTLGRGLPSARRFLAWLPADSKLQLLIVALDQGDLEGDPDTPEEHYAHYFERERVLPSNVPHAVLTLFKDFLKGKFSTADVFYDGNRGGHFEYGVSARALKNGFRNDGSYNNGMELGNADNAAWAEYGFKQSLGNVKNGTGLSFAHNRGLLSEQAHHEAEQLIAYANNRNIHLVVYLPPYPPSIFNAMEASGKYTYMRPQSDQLVKIFAGSGHTFFDATDPHKLGLTDDMFLDGNHTAERADAMVLERIAEQDVILREFLDVPGLADALQESEDPRVLFPTLVGPSS